MSELYSVPPHYWFFGMEKPGEPPCTAHTIFDLDVTEVWINAKNRAAKSGGG